MDFYKDYQHLNDDINETETEFIPLFTQEDEEAMKNESLPETLPILPLRNNVLFPGVVIPITVGRDKSIKLIQDAYKGDKTIGVVAQTDMNEEEPSLDQLYKVGTVAKIIKLLKMPDGSTTVIIQGKQKFNLIDISNEDPYFRGQISPFAIKENKMKKVELNALLSSLKDMAINIIKISPNMPSEASFAIKNIESFSFLVHFIASNMNAEIDVKQKILEQESSEEAAKLVLKNLTKELNFLEIKNDIQSRVRNDIDKQQREYFLHQQMKTIQDELGGNPQDEEVEELKKKAKKKKWNDKTAEAFNKEIERLQRLNPSAAEYSIQLNYLDTLVELPWNEYTKDNFNLKRAQRVLDKDHFGLEKVKERILEHLAVLKLRNDIKAPIICLYGPPGVGKTSLGKSIAKSLNREYVRMSLGGLRDEAEIRGHRKTYIGAMPGRIIQNLKKCGSSNPVFVLDEIDKLSHDAHGDPSSALLEVLDPEQNETFYDNFIEMDYDLSKVLFIATANNLASIQPALRDRMEIIHVNGYTQEEKLEIAKKYLIPKQLEKNGIQKDQIKLDRKLLQKVIEEYTAESGVRTLEKRIAKLMRYRAMQIAMEQEHTLNISQEELLKIYGPSHEKDKYHDNNVAGVVTGLAWTSVGGDILFVEASVNKGKGQLSLTGNLGKVMKESATIALEYLKSHSEEFGIDHRFFDNYNIHIHVPEGATPKDGPSAGVTMLTAITSAITQRKVRKYLAMTGEITLRGKVLPVGGIKEKILAAKRANIKEVLLCKSNEKDILDIDEKYLKGLKFHYVEEMGDVIKHALLDQKVDNAKSFQIGK